MSRLHEQRLTSSHTHPPTQSPPTQGRQAKRVIKHPTITIKQPVTSSLNNNSMWESNYTDFSEDNWGQMMAQIALGAFCANLAPCRRRRHSTGQAKPEAAALASTVRAEGHALLIWPCCYLPLLMENFMKQSSVSPQTQTDEGQSAEGREKKREEEEGSITKMTLERRRSGQNAKRTRVVQKLIYDIRQTGGSLLPQRFWYSFKVGSQCWVSSL